MDERITVNHKFNAKQVTTQDKIRANQTTSMQWFCKSNRILGRLFSAQKCNIAGHGYAMWKDHQNSLSSCQYQPSSGRDWERDRETETETERQRERMKKKLEK